jgi:hypothetical protein
VGLGPLQRFEVSVAGSFRYRPELTLSPPGGAAGTAVTLAAAQGVELWASLVDRHSWKDLRLGGDVSKTFGLGGATFQRSESLALRVFGSRELLGGKAEVEGEVGYVTMTDTGSTAACVDLASCYGTSSGSILSLGGTGYYRINRDWFGVASLFVAQTSLSHGGTADPAILGLTGFLRVAYRF